MTARSTDEGHRSWWAQVARRATRGRSKLASAALIVLLPTAAAIAVPVLNAAIDRIDVTKIAAVARQHPDFTVEQHTAVLREIQSELHPRWKDLPWSARLAKATQFATRLVGAGAAPAVAPAASSASFLGNMTAIATSSGQALGLQRQGNCSLSLYDGNLTLGNSPSDQILGSIPNYEQVLHNAAGLSTQADGFAKGCVDPMLGIGSRRMVYLGKTASNQSLFASFGFNSLTGNNALYYGTVDPGSMAVSQFSTDSSLPGIAGVAAGDLNGDGTADIIGIDATSASIRVWLANANGTLGTATTYALPGNSTAAAVVADVNGDGKADVIVATRNAAGQETISVLTGNGDGSLNTAQSYAVPTPAAAGSGANTQIANLIAADLRGNGKPDIVASNGLLLLNNGSGAFTSGPSAFSPVLATSSFGPNLAAGDFNNDGKLDLAVSSGAAIAIYLGHGDATFTAGKAYASNGSVGYLTATDLDGDGNVDLFVGLANGGAFGGDQFGLGQAYALLGNGDGTFQGAPMLPFVNTGSNLADLDGDHVLDAVGVNADQSFTSYLGDGKGGFSAHSRLVPSPFTSGGTSVPLQNIDSFALGDVDGDGIADLAYIAPTLNGIPDLSGGTGVFIASGDGQGGFGAAKFYPLPPVPSRIAGAFTIYPTISNLHLVDVNKDGKADLIYNYVYAYAAAPSGTNVDAGTAVQLGNGDGTFQAPQLIPSYSGPNLSLSGTGTPFITSMVSTADLNKDGIPDLIFLAQSATIDINLSARVATIQVALGRGDGTFTTPATVAGPDLMPGRIPASITVADMNGDGIPDIVALGASTSYTAQVAVSLGRGDGSFRPPLLTQYTAQYLNNSQAIAVADFNGDGKLDVAIDDPFDSTASGISLGNGDGTLQTVGGASAVLPKLAINLQVGGPMVAADFNGDGKADLLSGNVMLLGQAAPTSVGTPADFALGLSPGAGTVSAGQAAQTTLNVTPSGGFNQDVSLACSGLPSGATCSFSPAMLAVDGSTAATSTLTIGTAARTTMTSIGDAPFDPLLGGGVLLAGLAFPIALLRRRSTDRGHQRSRLTMLLLLAATLLQGCGGGGGGGSGAGGSGGTAAGTYAVTITATGGSATHATAFTLTVN